jgi:hypothetical protein
MVGGSCLTMLPFAFEFLLVVLYERDLRFHAANVSVS